MMSERLTRRQMLTRTGACAGIVAWSTVAAAQNAPVAAKEPFRYCLNTATIRGFKLGIVEEVEVVAKAGYAGIEPWIDGLRAYADGGRSLAELRRRIADLGLTVESAIGFPVWAVDDDAARAKGLEGFKREMDLIAQIGGTRIAAPPAGIYRTPGMDLVKIADRYRVVLELGRQMGVIPQLEIWGGAKTLGRMSEGIFVAAQANHPDACLLLDAFHLYKGGSGFEGLRLLNGAAMHVFHINDYPADPPRDKITDGERVFPGDGVAPLGQILRDLVKTGFRGALSLELFNKNYWKQDPLTTARTGLEKTRAVVARAFGQQNG
ncbi:MAG: sugar phosphate isomerase/epimerase family protein [Thermoguttaceae bacterium]